MDLDPIWYGPVRGLSFGPCHTRLRIIGFFDRNETGPEHAQPAAESAATEVPPETNLEQEVLTMGPPVNKRRRKRDRGETGSNAPSKVLRTERGTAADTQSVSEPEPLSFVVPRPAPEPDVAAWKTFKWSSGSPVPS
ncbi:hypothetical protein Tco_0804981 [Tanacetum coccineum]